MIRFGRHLIVITLYITIDILFISFSLFVASWIRQGTLPFEVTPHNLFFSPSNPFHIAFLLWVAIIIFVNNSYGLYQTKREIFETVEVWKVAKSVCLSALIMIVAIFAIKLTGFPRSILLLAATIMFLFLSLWRIMKRIFVEYLVTQGYNNFNVLIVGAGKVGIALAQEIQKKPALGLNVVGYLDDFKKDDSSTKGVKILGKISGFTKIARREFINKVFVTCHHDGEGFLRLLEQAKDLKIAIRVVPHGFELMTGEFTKYNIGFIPILEYCDAEHFHKQVGKRLFDFTTSFILAVLMFPVFLVITILIKLDSPGPVFYLSKRYGRGGRMFNMYKFRSMRIDADRMADQIRDKNEVDGPIFKIRNDPRITKIGCILQVQLFQ